MIARIYVLGFPLVKCVRVFVRASDKVGLFFVSTKTDIQLKTDFGIALNFKKGFLKYIYSNICIENTFFK